MLTNPHSSIRPRRALLAAGLVAAIVVPSGAAAASGWQGPVGADEPAASSSDLDSIAATDEADLVFMRQEEKLAGDVYAALYDAWGLQIFANIERSELHHQAQVAAMLEQLAIEDPVATMAQGTFANADIQALYDELVARGSTSVEEALRVGALIEELDISDLRARSSEVAEIDALYSRLEAASQNHLRAFVRNLDRIGVEYEPEILDVAEYEEIVSVDAPRPGAANGGRQARLNAGNGDQQLGQSGECRSNAAGGQNHGGLERHRAQRHGGQSPADEAVGDRGQGQGKPEHRRAERHGS